GDIVVDVKIGAAGLVVKVLQETADDLQRLLVGEGEVSAQQLLASRKRFLEGIVSLGVRAKSGRDFATRNWPHFGRGGTEIFVGSARIDCAQPREGRPRRLFRNGNVRVIRYQRFAVRGIHHAHGQARAHQCKERRYLLFLQREFLVVARENSAGRRQRIVFIKEGVGGGNSGFRDRE